MGADPRRLLSLLVIGGGSPDPARRCIPAWMSSWKDAVAMVPAFSGGVFLRGVAGLSPGDRKTDIGPSVDSGAGGAHLMVEVDGFDAARRDGMGWLADTFAGGWGTFNRPVIAYLGSVPWAWRFRTNAQLLEWVAPLLAAGPHVVPAFDSAAALLKDSPTFRLCKTLIGMGIRPYIEAAEQMPAQRHWTDLGCSVVTQTWGGPPTEDRLEGAWADQDRWMIRRDCLHRGADYRALIGVDDRARRLELKARWEGRGVSVAMYDFDLSADEAVGRAA